MGELCKPVELVGGPLDGMVQLLFSFVREVQVYHGDKVSLYEETVYKGAKGYPLFEFKETRVLRDVLQRPR